jgi:Clr5 domain
MNLHIPLANTEFKFKDGTARNATRVPNAKWDEHKELLCSLHKEMSVSEMLTFMRTEHGFVAK